MTPRPVSRFELNLVRLLHFFLGRVPAEQARPLFDDRRASPPCLSVDCVHLVKDSLAKGCVLFLVRNGGWRTDRYLRDGLPVSGRVWQRIRPDARGLSFGRIVLDFLIYVTAGRPDLAPATPWNPQVDLTPGDALFFLIAFDSLRALPAVLLPLREKSVFAKNPLCRLVFPADFPATDDPSAVDFDPWFTGPQAAILECLQTWLAARWLHLERSKGQEASWAVLGRRGRAEGSILDAYLAAADRHGRRDLARFVLRSASAILTLSELAAEFWSGGLRGDGPLRLQERIEIRRDAMVGPGRFGTLEHWTRQARGVGYFDDGYAANQLWKEDWEAANGDVAAATARRVLAEVEPLGPSSPLPSGEQGNT
jgi:hypothetical protein